MAEERPTPRGLKRLSLTPGARAPLSSLSSPRTPLSAGLPVVVEAPQIPSPGPLSATKRYAARRGSSISYYNSTNMASSPTSSASDVSTRTWIPPTIHETPVAASLQGPKSLQRSSSLPKRQRMALSLDTTTKASSQTSLTLGAQTATPPPQTLAEKHADLLSFIAKKEAKCLELREQLSQHESELAGLKRKWERIVARNGSSLNVSSVSPDSSPSPTARSTPLPATSEGVNEVVDVIRDGVTGLGRMLMMGGLGSPASGHGRREQVPVSNQVASSSAAMGTSSRNSSISSVTSPPGSSTGRTSLSSVTSVASEDEQDEMDSSSLAPSIADGGHTPTMDAQSFWSMEANFSTTNSSLTSSPMLPPAELDSMQPASTPAPRKANKRLSMGGSSTPSPRGSLNLADRLQDKKTPIRLTSPSPAASPSSWVPTSFNKRLEGLQKSDTISKTSKRASILFSDVTSASSNFLGSLAGALASPPSQVTPSRENTPSGSQSPAKYFPLVAIDSPNKNERPSPSRSASLLDEDNDDEPTVQLSGLNIGPPIASAKLSPVLQPTKPFGAQSMQAPLKASNSGFDDDEEWNW